MGENEVDALSTHYYQIVFWKYIYYLLIELKTADIMPSLPYKNVNVYKYDTVEVAMADLFYFLAGKTLQAQLR